MGSAPNPEPLIGTPELPTGGGAIKGMGDEWSVNLLTGTGAMSLPLPLSPGRGGFGPSLGLAYDSASGNGPFGLGWSLGVPSISRRTDRGIPKYQDAAESDTYLSAGAGELVRVPDFERTVAGVVGVEGVDGDWTVHRYRPRVESSFSRIERWQLTTDPSEVHWQVVSASNVRSVYGLDADSRVSDPRRPSRIFRWLLCRSFDNRGNVVTYTYRKEDDVAATGLAESQRDEAALAQQYLVSARYTYNNAVTCDGVTDPRSVAIDSGARFEVAFDYGQFSDYDPATANPPTGNGTWDPADDSGDWSLRNDAFSTYRQGFEVRTRRQCRRVLMFHEFPSLGAGKTLVKELRLTYDADPAGNRLAVATSRGYIRDAEDKYTFLDMPPLTMSYAGVAPASGTEGPQLLAANTNPQRLPSSSLKGLPDGVDGSRYRFVDLDGEGISGVLTEQAGGWYYKSNLGEGKFGAPSAVPSRPVGPALDSGGLSLTSVEGDSALCAVQLNAPMAGYFERDTSSGKWKPFRPFKTVPNLNWGDPDVRFVDIDGDGRADILVAEGDRFVWYESKGGDGYGKPKVVFNPPQEKDGPRVLFSDPSSSIFLADMSGDGLSDIVRVRCGDVCYWPNLGYGKFGRKVQMGGVRPFDYPNAFDASRIRLGDVDGSGTSDVLYFGAKGGALYVNESGNTLRAPVRIPGLPPTTPLDSVQLADLLGTGTSCIVWSSSAPGIAASPVRYVDLCGGKKPYVLTEVNNGRGLLRRVHYTTSTKFYLQHKREGRPWATKLPFPVQVIERVETIDLISGGRLASSYSYRHGYYDRREREFRGFGLVEQTDVEEFFSPAAVGEVSASDAGERPSDGVLTRTWHHLGADRRGAAIDQAFESEYWPIPTGEYDTPVVDEIDATGHVGRAEALRALKGSPIRSELFAIDTDGVPYSVPHVVTRSTYSVRSLQAATRDRRGVFMVSPRESVVHNYEGVLSSPRVAHAMTLDVDDYGHVRRAAQVAYGRLGAAASALHEPQHKLHAAVSESRVFHSTAGVPDGASGPYHVGGAADPDGWYRLGVPVDSAEWEYQPSASTAGALLSLAQVQTETKADQGFAAGSAGSGRVAPRADMPADEGLRLRRASFTLYCSDVVASSTGAMSALALGQVKSLALPFESFTLAFTDDVLEDAYGTSGHWVRDSLGAESASTSLADYAASLGYLTGTNAPAGLALSDSSSWWIRSGRVLTKDVNAFLLPVEAEDPFGAVSTVTYDDFDLLATAASQPPVQSPRMSAPVTLTSTFENDYRLLGPTASTDPNGNVTRVAVDALGMVVAMAVEGSNAAEGDSLPNEPTARYAYSHAYQGGGTPPCAQVEMREQHAADGTTWATVAKQVSISYVDGLGRTLSTIGRAGDFRTELEGAADPSMTAVKLRRTSGVEPGMRLKLTEAGNEEEFVVRGVNPTTKIVTLDAAPVHTFTQAGTTVIVERWAASGHTVYDHKERPVRQYEPYFTHTALGEAFGAEFEATPEYSLDEAETTVSAGIVASTGELDVLVASTVGFSPHQRARFSEPSGTGVDNVYDVIAVIDATTLRLRSATAAHPAGTKVTALPGRGVAATLTYDALGRNVRTDSPDGTFASTEWTPWAQTVSDACDNVVGSVWEARHAAGNTHEAAAAVASAAHANTPTVMLLDSLSRPYAVGTRSGPSDTTDLEAGLLYELSDYDSEGNVHRIQDRRSYLGALIADDAGRTPLQAGSLDAPEAFNAFVHRYDLAGRELHSWGMDNGTRWSLPDATGAPAQSWKGEDTPGEHWFMLRPEYDVLRRPTKLWETVDWESSNPPEPKCRVLTIYGEELSNPADDNYLGMMHAQYDSGGATIAQGYGLQGSPLGTKRTLALFIANKDDSSAGVLAADPDYSTASAVTTSFSDLDTSARLQLETESFVSEMSYDALGRVVESKAPTSDPTARVVHTYGYGKSGALSSIDVKDRTGQPHQILKYVEHNARGQRTRLERGNGVSSTFSYDPHSFRVTSIRAKKDVGPTLQELKYTYDAAGNVLRIKDAAQQDVYFSNTVVEPVQTFVVDALYRLVEATGREHAPVFGLDPSVLPEPSVGLPSDDVLQTYTRGYTYDAAGNMLKLDMNGGWTRNLTVAADSNRLVEVAHGDDPTTLNTLSSDQFGNMLGVPNVDVMRWDRAGNLRYSQSASGSNQRVWYQYGSDSQRVRKVVEVRTNSSSDWRIDRETLYLGGQEFYRTYDGNEALQYVRHTVHVMDADRREAMLECVVLDGGGPPSPINVTARYVLSDHLRSAGLELDQAGELISYETFHPYGTTAYYSVAVGSGDSAKRYRYSGKERDAETGLDYYGRRYLCSWLGRWVSADPAGVADGLNLTSFVRSRVSSQLDRYGLKGEAEHLTRRGRDQLGAMANYIADGVVLSAANRTLQLNPTAMVSPGAAAVTDPDSLRTATKLFYDANGTERRLQLIFIHESDFSPDGKPVFDEWVQDENVVLLSGAYNEAQFYELARYVAGDGAAGMVVGTEGHMRIRTDVASTLRELERFRQWGGDWSFNTTTERFTASVPRVAILEAPEAARAWTVLEAPRHEGSHAFAGARYQHGDGYEHLFAYAFGLASTQRTLPAFGDPTLEREPLRMLGEYLWDNRVHPSDADVSRRGGMDGIVERWGVEPARGREIFVNAFVQAVQLEGSGLSFQAVQKIVLSKWERQQKGVQD